MQYICNYCKKKGCWVKDCTKRRKKDAKCIKLDKKLDAKKSEHGNIMIYHNEAFVITTLLMFTMEHGM